MTFLVFGGLGLALLWLLASYLSPMRPRLGDICLTILWFASMVGHSFRERAPEEVSAALFLGGSAQALIWAVHASLAILTSAYHIAIKRRAASTSFKSKSFWPSLTRWASVPALILAGLLVMEFNVGSRSKLALSLRALESYGDSLPVTSQRPDFRRIQVITPPRQVGLFAIHGFVKSSDVLLLITTSPDRQWETAGLLRSRTASQRMSGIVIRPLLRNWSRFRQVID